ncbi:uncharacterized protein LOC131850041 [Achroia grisella]|uniref:uncharacterized protein LOC131850041 n=1 Tax=Achroia grisella TaxID=688607 RepID=UPI0027D34D3B|nr:uncharacterized protein LOC131850041 [Achroia grisella]
MTTSLYLRPGKKRRREEDNTSLVDEFRSHLAENKTQNDKKFASLQTAIQEVITQNNDIKESISFISKQYEDMKDRVHSLESERKADHRHIQELEEKIDSLERTLYSTKIEVRNIPQKQGESKEDLCNLLMQTTDVIESPIQRQDIKDIYRTGKKDGMLPIVVELASSIIKDSIIKKARIYNNKNTQNKLNTSHLKLKGQIKPLYISERLTPKTQHIYYLARMFAKENGFKYCWTSFGKVFLRLNDGKQHVLIRNESDLTSLSQNK